MIPFLCWSIAIAAHELGHSVTAWLLGVRVLRVSLFVDGWGWAPIRFNVGRTEIQIGWLPISGYTKLAGYDDYDAQVPPAAQFRGKGLIIRIAILLSGPITSTLLAILCATWLSNLSGTSTLCAPVAIGVLLNTYLATMSLLPIKGTDAHRALLEWSNHWFLNWRERRIQSTLWGLLVFTALAWSMKSLVSAFAVAC